MFCLAVLFVGLLGCELVVIGVFLMFVIRVFAGLWVGGIVLIL